MYKGLEAIRVQLASYKNLKDSRQFWSKAAKVLWYLQNQIPTQHGYEQLQAIESSLQELLSSDQKASTRNQSLYT